MNRMLEDTEAVIFDLDGSLVDSMGLWKEIDKEYLGRFGLTPPADLTKAIQGMSFAETAQYFKDRFQIAASCEEIQEEWTRLAWDKYRYEVDLKEGVLTFLDNCRSNGIKLGIATSNSRELVDTILTAHGIKSYFSCIMTGHDVEHSKPAPDIYLAAAEGLHADPARCLVFEDVVQGILAGKRAGMKVCAVEDLYSAFQRGEKKELADYYIDDYHQLEDAFL